VSIHSLLCGGDDDGEAWAYLLDGRKGGQQEMVAAHDLSKGGEQATAH
jgi:hypothetical protein